MTTRRQPLRVLLVAGARPNFVKVAPVLAALRDHGHEPVLVHTGQHYDARMSDAFFDDLSIPTPQYHLGVGSASHAAQTARIMEAFEPVLLEVRPRWVVVVGDVNSTLACALVAAKLKAETGVCCAHVEAGLRSRDWRMPEEINRVLTDRLCDLLFTPSADALPNLTAEGIEPGRVVFAGNVMIDTLFRLLPAARALDVPGRMAIPRGGYAVATVHRPSNVDGRAALERLLASLAAVAEDLPLVLPLHPRTRDRIRTYGFTALPAGIRAIPPLGYTEMLSLMDGAALVLTDSGGIQEETTALGVPCITLREQTERPITVTHGTNRLAGWPITPRGLAAVARVARTEPRSEPGSRCPPGWDGKASERIVLGLEAYRAPEHSSEESVERTWRSPAVSASPADGVSP